MSSVNLLEEQTVILWDPVCVAANVRFVLNRKRVQTFVEFINGYLLTEIRTVWLWVLLQIALVVSFNFPRQSQMNTKTRETVENSPPTGEKKVLRFKPRNPLTFNATIIFYYSRCNLFTSGFECFI